MWSIDVWGPQGRLWNLKTFAEDADEAMVDFEEEVARGSANGAERVDLYWHLAEGERGKLFATWGSGDGIQICGGES